MHLRKERKAFEQTHAADLKNLQNTLPWIAISWKRSKLRKMKNSTALTTRTHLSLETRCMPL